METYEHRQFSPWPLVAAGAVALLAKRGTKHSRSAVGLTLFLLQFCVLRTAVEQECVSWSFGAGFPGGAIGLADIESVETATTAWWEGFGIHWTPRSGWLWNAAGKDAVRIRKRNGATITLGTDDARGFCEAIRRQSTA